MAKKIKNERCPLQKECGRSCSYVNGELECDYYKNNAVGDSVIPDQEELRARLEAMREREAEALALPEDAGEAEGERQLVYLPTSELYPHPDNPREELGDLSELAESIKVKGVMQNLTVVPRAEGGYTVIIGHRRHAAAALAGLSALPCAVVDMTYEEQLQTMLLENMQRANLTVYEQAQVFRQLVMDFGRSVESVARETGFSETTIRRRLEMAKLNKKVFKDVSGRQLRLSDFERLARIKNMEKRNEVLEKIGTRNFNGAVENALHEELIAERMPLFVKRAEELGATKIDESERWSGKYEKISELRVTEDGAEDRALVPKEYLKDSLFYYTSDCWGDIEILRKQPKEIQVKRSKAEIEREKDIKERNRQLVSLNDMTRKLRAAFVRGLVMHSKNEKAVLMGAAQAIGAGVSSYQQGISARAVLKFIGRGTSDEYGGNNELFAAALKEEPQHVIPALIYLLFENNGNASYGMVYNGYPKHAACARLDALYGWLCSLGYEMSDDELALRRGTHELFLTEGSDKNA